MRLRSNIIRFLVFLPSGIQPVFASIGRARGLVSTFCPNFLAQHVQNFWTCWVVLSGLKADDKGFGRTTPDKEEPESLHF